MLAGIAAAAFFGGWRLALTVSLVWLGGTMLLVVVVVPGAYNRLLLAPRTSFSVILNAQMATQHDISLHMLDTSIHPATRTGNNASWMCPCGRARPLLAAIPMGGRGSVTCPDCGRHYQVIGQRIDERGEQAGVPVRVEQRENAR